MSGRRKKLNTALKHVSLSPSLETLQWRVLFELAKMLATRQVVHIYKCLNVPIVSSQIIPHPRFEDFQSTLARSSVAFVKYCTASQFSQQPGIKLILSQLFYSVIHSGLLLVKIHKQF